MKTKTIMPASTTISEIQNGDTSKLLSLLALATGAVAIPQTSNADIIYTDLSSSPVVVGFSGNLEYLINNLPGGATLRFFRTELAATSPFTMTTNMVAVAVGPRYLGGVKHNANGFVAVTTWGKHWNEVAGNPYTGGAMAQQTFFGGRGPSAYYNKYMAFMFSDATHGGRNTYGWVNVSLSYGYNGPDITIFGYAYDDAGTQIAMGAVPIPEPGSAALLALGALALGAKGVRSWRRNRAAASQQS